MAAGDPAARRWGDAQEPHGESSPRRRPSRGRRAALLLLVAGMIGTGLYMLHPVREADTKGPRLEPAPAAVTERTIQPPAVEKCPPRVAPEQWVAEAKRVARRLLHVLPDSPQALVLAGRIHYAFNDADQAQAYWDACLKAQPEFAEARCALAEAAWEHGNFEEAAAHLSAVFSANPRLDQKQLCFLADALLNLGEMRKAAAVLERAAEHQPLTPFGRFLLAQAYLQTDEFAKAQTHFEAVLAADPKAINAHYGLATVYARLGQVTAAQRHKDIYAQLRQGELAESARLRPEMRKADWADPRPVVRECYLNAGKLYLTSNQPEEAEQHWLRAAEIDPQDVRPRQLLAALYQALGRREAALRLAKDLPPAP